MRSLGEKSRSEFLWWKEWFFFFLYKKFRSSFYIYKWKENKFFYESVNFYQKHRFGFILKNSDMILMKNIDLAFGKEKKKFRSVF